MNSLIVAANRQISSELCSAVRRSGAENIVLAFDVTSAKRAAGDRAFDLVVIYSEDFPGSAIDLARAFATRGEGGVILIEKALRADDVAMRLENDGVIVLAKPLSHTSLFQAIKIIRASNKRIAKLLKEKQDLLRKLEEIRLVSRAKIILMQNTELSEEQAHHYIEKNAMDTRRPRAEVALDILRQYEV